LPGSDLQIPFLELRSKVLIARLKRRSFLEEPSSTTDFIDWSQPVGRAELSAFNVHIIKVIFVHWNFDWASTLGKITTIFNNIANILLLC
jgi:hypothetical protein